MILGINICVKKLATLVKITLVSSVQLTNK